MITLNKKQVVLPAAAILALGQLANAAVLFQDNFDSYTETLLEGQGGWASDATGNTATVKSGAVEISTTTTHRGIQNTLSTAHTAGQTIYFSFLAQAASDGGYVNALAIGASDDIKYTGGGDSAKIGIAGDKLAMKIGTDEDKSSTTPVDGTTYLFVGKLEFNVGGVNERLTMWVDPASESDTPLLTNNLKDLGYDTITHVGLASINYDGNATEALADNVIVSTTFAEAVPEPSSTALLGLGGLALMLRRRR